MTLDKFLEQIKFTPVNIIYDKFDDISIIEFNLRNSDKHKASIEFCHGDIFEDELYVYLEILDLTNYIDSTIIDGKVRKVHLLKWIKSESDYDPIISEINRLMISYNKGGHND